MTVARIEVRELDGNPREHRLVRQAKKYFQVALHGAEEWQAYWLKAASGKTIPQEEIQHWAGAVFSDPIMQQAFTATAPFQPLPQLPAEPSFVIEVRFLPGVTDNVGRSATEALSLTSAFAKSEGVRVYSGKIYYVYGAIPQATADLFAQELLGNALIQEVRTYSWAEYKQLDRFTQQKVPEVTLDPAVAAKEISLEGDDRQLERMSREGCWALTVAELHAIRAYFAKPEVQALRKSSGLPAQPTDVEVEMLAQTWSEHCKHKIFNAEIDYTEDEKITAGEGSPLLGAFTVKSIFKSYIRGATQTVREERKLPWLVSVFTDNAGVVRFDPQVDLCIKVETHNSPSALDPYGGALTGIVGVNRDVLGCGMGARPIANTDVFCFAPPDWPGAGEERELPQGLKHPRRIFDGVHLGVEDGGNKSGIPTVNGAFAFHRDFAGKPLVFCGTVGVMPQALPSGREGSGKFQEPGHRVVMAGGRIGKDGVHGATFSSMELNEGAPATVVQIGDPITQKRCADFLLEARDKELFSSVTDNGAGGLSSSVGEMAQATGGAVIDVGLAPTKYPGLVPYELLVSESQERMTFAVPPAKWAEFKALADRRGVEVTDLGEFTADGLIRILYKGVLVGALHMEFLHDGLPPMVLKARWQGKSPELPWSTAPDKPSVSMAELNSRQFLERALYTLLGGWNVRSKEEWVRRYDHEVQAATVGKPFVGKRASGPGDAGVLWLAPHGGDAGSGVAISCGLQPKLAAWDAYLMAQHALDEAMRNAVAVGADPDQVALCDNFCWPDPLPGERNPDAAHKMAQLVRAAKGLRDLSVAYGAPFVSGKDSMKNDFVGRSRFGKEVKISVPPTVLVTALAKVPDINRVVSSDFKTAGDFIFLLGSNRRGLGGSELEAAFSLPERAALGAPPGVEPAAQLSLYRKLHQAIRKGWIKSCHDCSEGGLLVALAESALGGELGVAADLDKSKGELESFSGSLAEFFFQETPGRFVVSVSESELPVFLAHFAGQPCLSMGRVSEEPILRVMRHGLVLLDTPLSAVQSAWKGN